MTHLSEAEFQPVVREWFECRYGVGAVERNVYQPVPRWYCDLVVDAPPVTFYVEVENDAASIRSGTGQALGYAAADTERGVPLVVVPAGHTEPADVRRLQQGSRCLIRAFDAAAGEWVDALP